MLTIDCASLNLPLIQDKQELCFDNSDDFDNYRRSLFLLQASEGIKVIVNSVMESEVYFIPSRSAIPNFV